MTQHPRLSLGLEPGSVMGVSDWTILTQEDFNTFGKVTRDEDPMHTDPDWCAAHGPFPTTISFGFFTLSLLTGFSHQASRWPEGAYAINYGFDRIRFLAPVPVNSRVRGRFVFLGAEPREDGSFLSRMEVTVEIEGVDKPALVAEWLGLVFPPEAQRRLDTR